MTEFDHIPASILAEFRKNGIADDGILFAMRADRDAQDNHRDTFLVMTPEMIGVLSCDPMSTSSERKKKKTVREQVVAGTFSVYPTEGLQKIVVEERSSTSSLIAISQDGTCVRLASMTNFCKVSASLFARYGNKVLEGETDIRVLPEDLPSAFRCPKCGMRYPDVNQKVCPHCMKKTRAMGRMMFFLKKYRFEMLGAFMTLCLSVGFSIIGPYFSSGFFYDQVLSKEGNFFGQLGFVLMLVVVTRFLMYVSIMLNQYVTSAIAVKMIYDLRKTIFGAIERLSLRFFTGRHTGGLMNQVNSDTEAIYNYFCNDLPYFLMCVVQLVVLVVLLFTIQPVLAALVLTMMPVYMALMLWIHNRNRKLRAAQHTNASSLNSQLSDVLTGARVVKAFSQEKQEIRRFGVRNRRLAESERKLSLFHNYVSPMAGLVLYISNVVTLGYGGFLVISGELTYGELLTFIAYMGILYTPLNFFVDMLRSRAYYTNAAQRLFEIMDARPEITEKEDPIRPETIRGDVEFRNVEFSYDKNHRIVDNVSFSVKAGKTLGIVGHSGAGKSTLVNLLMRLYETEGGEILIDGVNIRDLSFEKLYGSIAIVSQETYLFVGSILDNIRYARQNASYEDVIAASKIAGAHDFIMNLPDGYETRIGLGNHELSGGEKQRLSIARAVLRNPEILILDEATAAMDTQTERRIQEALTRISSGKTTILIAHRLSTLRDADSLVVIEHGKVAECGTHQELLKKEDGVYRKLYLLQEEALRNAGICEWSS